MAGGIQNANFRTAISTCSVCGRQAGDGAGWCLISENTWLDQLKILRWHPILAEQETMHGVCCTEHLRVLLAHWLNYANLRFPASPSYRRPSFQQAGMMGSPSNLGTALIGELAIHRESLSRTWSGSAQTLQSILEALSTGLGSELTEGPSPEAALATAELSALDQTIDRAHYSLQIQPTGA